MSKMDKTNRPILMFTNDADQVNVQMEFGYLRGEPTVAMLHKELLILIPKDVLQIALEQGWDMTCPECEHSLDTDATECPTGSANDHLGDGEETYE